MPEPLGDPLEALRRQLEATRQAAERLNGQARDPSIPPMGWASPEAQAERTTEVQQLTALLEAIGALVPAELEGQFRDVVRQVLLLVRGMLDWWVARLEPGAPSPSSGAAPEAGGSAAVQDIPIE